MIKAIKFANIPVTDQSRALEFYTKKLGFEILTDQPMGKQRWIELKIPGAETRVSLFTPPGHESRVGTFVPLSLWADDVEGTYQALSARGVEFVETPEERPYGIDAGFRDPSGNHLRLTQVTIPM